MHVDKSELFNYDIRLIVAGTRGFNDYSLFSKTMDEYVAALDNPSIVFITGKAKTGADNLIIEWCKEHNKPWVEFPADWNRYRKAAGHIRNAEMGHVGTHLMTFHDGMSSGTQGMLDIADKKILHVKNVLINTNSKF